MSFAGDSLTFHRLTRHIRDQRQRVRSSAVQRPTKVFDHESPAQSPRLVWMIASGVALTPRFRRRSDARESRYHRAW